MRGATPAFPRCKAVYLARRTVRGRVWMSGGDDEESVVTRIGVGRRDGIGAVPGAGTIPPTARPCIECRARPLADDAPRSDPATASSSRQPAQTQQPPAARQTQQPAPRQARPKLDDDEAPKPATKPKVAAAAAPANTVTCGGVFVKDTNHLKLAIKYDSRNIVFSDVDGPEGTKIKATVLYPNEARRRLEVIWNNDAARTDLSMIVINGQSQWAAPKGVKLGTTLAALEKLNGRPFKLGGFDTDGSASVLGWEGGALAKIPGGCRVGVRLTADTKAAGDAVTGDKQLMSSDPNLKNVKASIAEILVGY